MNPFRLLRIAQLELGRNLRRPLFWILILIVVLLSWGLSKGGVTISSGDSSVGGQKAWTTSEFGFAFVFLVVGTLIYLFFLAVGTGMSILQDEEHGVLEVLHATPLRPGEYVIGKFLGAFLPFVAVLSVHVAVHVVFQHVVPAGTNEELRGPFELDNYVRPILLFTMPFFLFLGGTAFALGTITRRPILVFFMPVAIFLACLLFFWQFDPSWLPTSLNHALMLLDPSGFRWFQETLLEIDRGVEYYNTANIPYEVGFLASRVGYALFGVGAVLVCWRHYARTLRGKRSLPKPKRTEVRRAVPAPAIDPVVGNVGGMAALGMRSRAPGWLRGFLEIARVEVRGLIVQPGLYLFVPLILVETIAVNLVAVGAFDTPLLQTPGTLAVRSMQALTIYLCFLLMFYMVESLRRERGTGIDSIYYATPVKTLSLLSGKAFANTVVAGVILFACWIGCAAVLVLQGTVEPRLEPFLLVWGLLLLPTFFGWSALVAALYSITRNRYTTYAISLGLMAYTGFKQFKGEMSWVGNWTLWNTVQWTDMGPLELNRDALILNRALVLLAGVFFTILAVRFFPRRAADASAMVFRLRPKPLLMRTLGLVLVALPAIVCGGALYGHVADGFQGSATQKRVKDYWRKNVRTWRDTPTPDIDEVELDVRITPETRRMKVRGSYRLSNTGEETLAKFAVTVADHYEDLRWTLDGNDYAPEERSLLHVIEPDGGLAAGGTVKLGFSYSAEFPRGFTKNGGGVGQFILPSGVVLTSFGPSFVPTLGFVEGMGVDEKNQAEAKDYDDDFYEGVTKSGFGGHTPYSTRVQITAPSEYTMNSVGSLVNETTDNGWRTVVWESEHPVSFFNIVGGRYDVRRGEGTALYYHPEHTYNIDEMIEALDGARKWYAEWFHPFPWKELRVSEFPALAGYAQGFPTNISFSEAIGFLTRSTPEAQAAFMVTAHEAAHQWWGNILVPGMGPGGNILSEGMAHFSTALLIDQIKGAGDRIEFLKRIEEAYGSSRQADSERPLVKIDGSRAGDNTVTYDKGGWVFWMLLNEMGRERCFAGIRDFIDRFYMDTDHPVLQDFVAVMREHAEDVASFDGFVDRWFFEVVVPEYVLEDARAEATGSGHEVTVTVTNRGTGTIPVEVAAARGERFPKAKDDEPDSPSDYRDARVTVSLAAGESREVTIACDFEPTRVLVDPDALVLMLKREHATAALE